MASKKTSQQQHNGRTRRRVEIRELKQRFLIVCEGKKTEPNYFDSFKVPTVKIKIVGLGQNTVSLVEKAVEMKDEDEYDQVWCVFDRDEFPAEHFNRAFQLAKKHGLKIAYSNEAFELWYLLHFAYHHTAITRQDYIVLLQKHLGGSYQKNSQDMYDRLLPYQPQAIKNAQKLFDQYIPRNPERDNPSTTVHFLVLELNKFCRE